LNKLLFCYNGGRFSVESLINWLITQILIILKVIEPRRINGKCNVAHNDFVEKPEGNGEL
jgi:hypothetical protein